jgi:hypothetical protein
MGRQQPRQPQLSYTDFNLEARVRRALSLRVIAEHVDFEFVYKEVGSQYGCNGAAGAMYQAGAAGLLSLLAWFLRQTVGARPRDCHPASVTVIAGL